MSLILGRPQSLASWQIESATPVEEYFDRASKAVKREGGKMLISWATVSAWF